MCSGHGKRILSVEFFWVGVMRSGEVANPQASQNRHLLLGTVSFTVCFAAWGLVSAFAPHFRQMLHLSATQTAFLVAVPVLLGSRGTYSNGDADRPVRWSYCFQCPDVL